MSAIKWSIVDVKGAFLFLAHVLTIASVKVNGDMKYKLYSNGGGLKQPAVDLLSASGVNLTNGGTLKEFEQFQNYPSICTIIVYVGLTSDKVIFE